jgi:hypothetical protein
VNPLTEAERKDKILKMKAINNIRKNVGNDKMARSLNHNFYRTTKVLSTTRKWANFSLSRLQGSTIQYLENLDDVKLYATFKAHPDDQKVLDEKNKVTEEFMNRRGKILKRRLT